MQRSEQGAASKRVAKFEWLTLISVFATPIFWSKMGRIADILRVLKATRMTQSGTAAVRPRPIEITRDLKGNDFPANKTIRSVSRRARPSFVGSPRFPSGNRTTVLQFCHDKRGARSDGRKSGFSRVQKAAVRAGRRSACQDGEKASSFGCRRAHERPGRACPGPVWFWWTAAGFLPALIWATILAVALWPIQRRLIGRMSELTFCGGREYALDIRGERI